MDELNQRLFMTVDCLIAAHLVYQEKMKHQREMMEWRQFADYFCTLSIGLARGAGASTYIASRGIHNSIAIVLDERQRSRRDLFASQQQHRHIFTAEEVRARFSSSKVDFDGISMVYIDNASAIRRGFDLGPMYHRLDGKDVTFVLFG